MTRIPKLAKEAFEIALDCILTVSFLQELKYLENEFDTAVATYKEQASSGNMEY